METAPQRDRRDGRPKDGGVGEYRYGAHAPFDLKYHMIWCTKFGHETDAGRISVKIQAAFFMENVLQLEPEALREIVEKKATCPFIGTAVRTGILPIRNEVTNPLARIEDVRTLGNTGGGDLGNLLVLFATGNHGFMRDPHGQLAQKAPDGFFSLEFPGSQGSHPGHSGILEGDPGELDSGRFSLVDFHRLANRAIDGLIKRSDVGNFIAENLRNDPKSKVFGASIAGLLAHDLEEFVARVGSDLLERLRGDNSSLHTELEEKLTRLTGEDNLVASSGEYGLLFAFLAKKPEAKELGGEPTLSLQDIESMFVLRRFPQGWEGWKKTRADWIINSTALIVSAGKAYLKL
jgi:hypothetical protein